MLQGISRHKTDTKVAIALGSNVAHDTLPCHEIVKAAFSAMCGESVRLLAASRLYRTPCVPTGAGPDYVNAAAIVETSLSAGDLLEHLHEIEKAFDRRRESRWASRTLDLDLLDYGGSVAPDIETWRYWHELPFEDQKRMFPDQLILPHPRIQDRAFVLLPLAEIAPGWHHPVLGKSIAEFRAELTEDQLAGISAI